MQSQSRPSAAEVQATAAVGAADPTVLLAAEPLPNFGVARFRIADYADCVGENGCYWTDVDAQTKRAAAALGHVLATKKPGEKLAMVLDIDEDASGDVAGRLRPWTAEINRALVARSLREVAGRLPPGAVEDVSRYPAALACARP